MKTVLVLHTAPGRHLRGHADTSGCFRRSGRALLLMAAAMALLVACKKQPAAPAAAVPEVMECVRKIWVADAIVDLLKRRS